MHNIRCSWYHRYIGICIQVTVHYSYSYTYMYSNDHSDRKLLDFFVNHMSILNVLCHLSSFVHGTRELASWSRFRTLAIVYHVMQKIIFQPQFAGGCHVAPLKVSAIRLLLWSTQVRISMRNMAASMVVPKATFRSTCNLPEDHCTEKGRSCSRAWKDTDRHNPQLAGFVVVELSLTLL